MFIIRRRAYHGARPVGIKGWASAAAARGPPPAAALQKKCVMSTYVHIDITMALLAELLTHESTIAVAHESTMSQSGNMLPLTLYRPINTQWVLWAVSRAPPWLCRGI